MKENINKYLVPKDCCGCIVCASICPKDAITMVEDPEGFKYPQVNEDRCISCSLCVKTCPVIAREKGTITLNNIKTAYAMKHKDETILENSTSGGIFTALSDKILDMGGVIYGAAFDENMVVRHIRAVDSADRDKMRGSKYVQSDMEGIFPLIKQDLQNGKYVLFSGTPCQIEGLKLFHRGRTDNLLCVDLVCHGVPSPKILKDYFRLLERNTHSQIIRYQFRPKRWTWHVHREIAFFENGKEKSTELWPSIYYSRLATRPSCHNCKFTNLHRAGDITIADCRGIDKIKPDFGSNEGVSLVLINTDKGAEALKTIKNEIVIEEVNIKDLLQPPMKCSSTPNPRRDLFWNVYFEKGLQEALYAMWGRFYSLKNRIKKILKR